MKPRKSFDAPAPLVVATAPMPEKNGAIVSVGDALSGRRKIDLTKWFGQGIDD